MLALYTVCFSNTLQRGRRPAKSARGLLPRCVHQRFLCLRDMDLPSQRLQRGGSMSITDTGIGLKFWSHRCSSTNWDFLHVVLKLQVNHMFPGRSSSSTFSWRVTTMWVNRPLKISQLGQLSLSSFRGRYMS